MKLDVSHFLWPMSEAGRGIESLAIESKLPIRDVVLPPVESFEWLDHACDLLGLEFDTATGTVGELDSALVRVAPGMILFQKDLVLLFLVASSGDKVTLLTTDARRQTVSARDLALALRARYAPGAQVPEFLQGMLPAKAYDRAFAEQREGAPLFAVLSLRIGTSQPFRQELQTMSLKRRVVLGASLLVLQSAVAIVATVLLGRTATNGQLDSGRILGWGLAIATQALLQGVLSLIVGGLNIGLSTALKRRLLDGALLLEPDFVRQSGIGANLSLAAESATVDQLSVADVVDAVSTLLIFLTAMAFLLTEDLLASGCLVLVTLLGFYLLARLYRASSSVTQHRIKQTDIFVERVLGHPTRLVQLPRSRWHEGEDESIFAYTEEAKTLDFLQTALTALPRLGMLLFAAIQLRFLFGVESRYLDLLPLVAAYVAMQALTQLLSASQRLMRWPIALGVLLPVLNRSVASGGAPLTTKLSSDDISDGDLLLDASGIRFGYHPLRPAVLNGLDLSIHAGDQVLVTGPSGGGKSTLSAILTALRQPSAGVVMLRGLDQHSVTGAEWRRHIVSAPQFHENYIFQNTLAFNLLMGRRWPALPSDLQEAEALCIELGLGDLLNNMPAGIQQVVGETGWRLSHGERSRVFIARALLQNADVLIFDESFGALDPETLELAMASVRERARTLLVISHK